MYKRWEHQSKHSVKLSMSIMLCQQKIQSILINWVLSRMLRLTSSKWENNISYSTWCRNNWKSFIWCCFISTNNNYFKFNNRNQNTRFPIYQNTDKGNYFWKCSKFWNRIICQMFKFKINYLYWINRSINLYNRLFHWFINFRNQSI